MSLFEVSVAVTLALSGADINGTGRCTKGCLDLNVRALVQAESDDAQDGGSFGCGWVLSGGPDRRLDTTLSETKLNPDSDDIGRTNGKKIGPR